MSEIEVELPDPDATDAIAAKFAKALPAQLKGWNVLLRGELGAGKSTFARALLHALGHDGAVPSPTYTLVEPYQLGDNIIYHVDLYRVADVDELEFLGWTDMQDGLRLVEWPERVPALLTAADLDLEFCYAGDGRLLQCGAESVRGATVLRSMFPESA